MAIRPWSSTMRATRPYGVRGATRERGRDGRRRVARADETRGRRPDWRTSGQEPARILAVEIACPAWRVLCSAAWNRAYLDSSVKRKNETEVQPVV